MNGTKTCLFKIQIDMTSKKLDIYHGYNILISLLLMRVFYEIDCRQIIFLGILK